MIGKNAATKNHAASAHEAVGTNGDRFAVLSIVLQIDGVAEQLGAIAGDGGEGADADAVGGVDVVMFGDGGMGTK